MLDIDICGFCAVMITNDDDSSDPERGERAREAAFKVWGSKLRELALDCDQRRCHTDEFDCGYCRERTYDYKHHAVILGSE